MPFLKAAIVSTNLAAVGIFCDWEISGSLHKFAHLGSDRKEAESSSPRILSSMYVHIYIYLAQGCRIHF